jgi:hypothetical protein
MSQNLVLNDRKKLRGCHLLSFAPKGRYELLKLWTLRFELGDSVLNTPVPERFELPSEVLQANSMRTTINSGLRGNLAQFHNPAWAMH